MQPGIFVLFTGFSIFSRTRIPFSENTVNKTSFELSLGSTIFTSPFSTGFGYIEANGEDVLSFKEKPDAITAQAYLDAGNYYWNSGMFCFKAGVFLEELKKHSPEIYETSLLAYNNAKIDEMIRISHNAMSNIPEDSIDYAVMEKSDKVKVIPSDIDWSDLGSFESLDEEIDSSENVINIDSSNNLILSSKQVATIDVDDLIIIDTADALLVSKKGSSQKVKEVVKRPFISNLLPSFHFTH